MDCGNVPIESAIRRGDSAADATERSGRDVRFIARPPAQNRTCGFPAYGSHLGCVTANCRMRSSACDTLIRFCARHVLCWPRSEERRVGKECSSRASAPEYNTTLDCSALFAAFSATLERSE